MVKTAVFHIGAHKTGTTYLQASLSRSSDEIKMGGVTYIPQKDYWPLMSSDVVSVEEEIVKSGVLERSSIDYKFLRSAFLGSDTEYTIFSHEDLSGTTRFQSLRRMYPGYTALTQGIYSAFDDFNVKFVLSVREQASFFESCLLQQLQQGAYFDISDAISKFDFTSMSWASMYNHLVDLVGKENVLILWAEDCREDPLYNTRKLLNNLSDHPFEINPPSHSGARNVSLSQLGLDLTLASAGRIKGEDWARFRKYLRDNFSDGRRRPKILPESVKALIKAYFKQENDMLRDLGSGFITNR